MRLGRGIGVVGRGVGIWGSGVGVWGRGVGVGGRGVGVVRVVDREDGWGEDVGGWWGVHSRSWESLGQIRRGWVFHSLSWESAGVRDGGGVAVEVEVAGLGGLGAAGSAWCRVSTWGLPVEAG